MWIRPSWIGSTVLAISNSRCAARLVQRRGALLSKLHGSIEGVLDQIMAMRLPLRQSPCITNGPKGCRISITIPKLSFDVRAARAMISSWSVTTTTPFGETAADQPPSGGFVFRRIAISGFAGSTLCHRSHPCQRKMRPDVGVPFAATLCRETAAQYSDASPHRSAGAAIE